MIAANLSRVNNRNHLIHNIYFPSAQIVKNKLLGIFYQENIEKIM